MHLAIALFSLFAAWRWGDWKHWKKYHTTMFYIMAGGLLYEYLTSDYTLWVFHPDFLYNQTLTVIIYAVITMPFSVLIFLSRYPSGSKLKEISYICMWIFIYASVELALYYCGRISYKNGWNFGYSILFDAMMFPMLRLHYVRPLLSYPISVLIIILLMWWFKVPLK